MEGPDEAAQGSRTSIKACLECRKVKMRCSLTTNGIKCERCLRKSLECVYREHRRGRKPGTRLSTRKASSNNLPSSPIEQTPQENHPPELNPSDGIQQLERTSDWETGNLQPASLLHHAATKGRFSLRNVLSPTTSNPIEALDESTAVNAEDPVELGFINLSIAKSLFENFMTTLNPYICHLDPVLHSFEYVRRKSSFLLSAIFATAAKSFNPALYDRLRNHAEGLLADNFRYGRKSTEIAQAMLILTYWKEPEDTRAWLTLGYVIRMGIDLGWHKLVPYSIQGNVASSETARREERNVERTWYILFVYDRSISLQTGKPWMIERDEFIESIEAWCRDTTAISNDRLLGAFVTLRLLSSEVFKLLGPKPRHAEPRPLRSLDSLLTIINGRIEEWQHRWIKTVNTEEQSCHTFLIRFYATHLRLQLYSLPLAELLAQREPNMSTSLEMLWVSYSSAIDMLELLNDSTQWLYFAQDSIHIMTAYSAAFLIKLLLSIPEPIVREIESKTINCISRAAQVFIDQAAPPGSSCALQAKFLERITSSFIEKRKEYHQRPGNNLNEAPLDLQSQVQRYGRNGPQPLPSSFNLYSADNSTAPSPAEIQLHQAMLDFSAPGDNAWTDIFASAGFNITDGIFHV